MGKRAVDYFSRRAYETRVFQEYAAVESIDLERSFELARLLTDLFRSGEADEVVLVYTEFASMLSQVPACRKILPLSLQRRNWKATARQIPLAQQNLIRPSGMSWPGSCPSLWAA